MPTDCHLGLRPVVESSGVLFGFGDTNLNRCLRHGRPQTSSIGAASQHSPNGPHGCQPIRIPQPPIKEA